MPSVVEGEKLASTRPLNETSATAASSVKATIGKRQSPDATRASRLIALLSATDNLCDRLECSGVASAPNSAPSLSSRAAPNIKWHATVHNVTRSPWICRFRFRSSAIIRRPCQDNADGNKKELGSSCELLLAASHTSVDWWSAPHPLRTINGMGDDCCQNDPSAFWSVKENKRSGLSGIFSIEKKLFVVCWFTTVGKQERVPSRFRNQIYCTMRTPEVVRVVCFCFLREVKTFIFKKLTVSIYHINHHPLNKNLKMEIVVTR